MTTAPDAVHQFGQHRSVFVGGRGYEPIVQRSGTVIERECRLGAAQLENASSWIDDYRRAWERRLDRFGAFVERR